MLMTHEFTPGGYQFIPGPFQYSGGVAALYGYQIQRMRFRRPLLIERGFEAAADIIRSAGRPLSAFCACELRSPAPFTEQQFRAFNEVYVETLSKWGIFDGVTNPVARSNVCPAINPPAAPSIYAFSFTTPAEAKVPKSFVIAGSAEAPEGQGSYKERCIRRGDTSPEGMRKRVQRKGLARHRNGQRSVRIRRAPRPDCIRCLQLRSRLHLANRRVVHLV